MSSYNSRLSAEKKAEFEKEVERWIDEGVLQEYNVAKHGEVNGIIPLMAVCQEKKNKVRPVLDYRELNTYIKSAPGPDSAVCDEKLRDWRRLGESVKLLDLKNAYLQVHIDESLWRYQVVAYHGKYYVMTRLGFGLSIGPKVMTQILKHSIDQNERVREAVDFYIDDIIVKTDQIQVDAVRQHLQKYGLVTKEPEDLSGVRVLGLRVKKDGGIFKWTRDACLPELPEKLTKRNLY